MCGIAGAFAWSPTAPVIDRAEMRRVRDRMAARGPDGTGEWFSDDGRVAFMHRRLAIIDLSNAGLQPMFSADRRYAIVFNGEIYNYRELRQSLVERGCKFASDSDTEVLLQLYALDGRAMLPQLRGMFALAIWDSVAKQLFLARDTFGIKPLYYTVESGRIRFASQVKALLETDVDRSRSPAGRVGFYLWGSVPEPHTLYRSIRALPAVHSMTVDERGALPAQPFETVRSLIEVAANKPRTVSHQAAFDAIADAVRDSIRAHQVADVPVGLFLSAGLDSSMLADVSTAMGYRTQSLTVGFREYVGTIGDEVPLAESIARVVGTQHQTSWIGRSDFEEDREKIFDAMDQPTIDAINTWFVARAAKAAGLKVALSGLGGDELFGSYPSFRDVPRMRLLASPFANAPTLGKSLRRAMSFALPRFVSPKYAGIPEIGATSEGAYFLRRGLFMPWELRELIGGAEAERGLSELGFPHAYANEVPQTRSWRSIVSGLESSLYMRNQLLRDADWAGMAHSIEIRVPFVDRVLLQACTPYLIGQRAPKKAQVAKAIGTRLSPNVIGRRKTGFTVPVRDWLMADASRDESKKSMRNRGLRGWAQFVEAHFQ
jgi:asparagine synthase (glutamine-hydrolysing)